MRQRHDTISKEDNCVVQEEEEEEEEEGRKKKKVFVSLPQLSTFLTSSVVIKLCWFVAWRADLCLRFLLGHTSHRRSEI